MEFLIQYDESCVRKYGYPRPVISEVVQGFLKCGDLAEGFARVRCPDCHHEYLVAFSCRGRFFCPSCHAKKVVQFGMHLKENILYPVPHRQYVFSIPIILRTYFKYDRKLLGKFCHCVNQSLLQFFRKATGLKKGTLAAVMAIQTFGDYANWHPHIHVLLADGLFRENGVFYVMPKADIQPLAELFRASILKMLKKEGRIDDGLIEKLLKWKHNSGFSIHNGVRLARDDEAGRESLAQYIMRNPFSVKKITYNSATGTVIYKSKKTPRKNKCGSEMKIVSFINEADVIRKILKHLGLWEEKAPKERAPPVIRRRRYEPFDDGWPQYEEPSATVH